MISSKALMIGVFGAGCLAAAGVGGYVAVRTGSTPAAAMAGAPAAGPDHSTSQAGPAAGTAATRKTPPVTAGRSPSSTSRLASRESQSSPAPRSVAPPSASPGLSSAPAPANAPGAEPVAAVDAASVPALGPDPEPAEAVVIEPEPAVRHVSRELTVGDGSVIGIRLDAAVTSATARVEDRVAARVTRDVTVDGITVIPAGSRLEGTVSLVERGGRFRDRARIGIRFTSVTLGTNLRLPIQTETIFRDGQAPGGEATSKIGASAVVGTILGAVIGGKKGAAIGGAAGAAGGTAAVMSGGPNDAMLPAGATLTVRLTSPLTVTVDARE